MPDINFSNIKAVGIDLDGVVYFGNNPAHGAVRTIEAIHNMGLKVFFITNNSIKTRTEIVKKLSNIGIKSTLDEIFSSGYATAVLLNRLNCKSKINVCVIGTNGLKEELSQVELNLVEDAPCDFLVVGYDREFTYKKISIALDVLLSGAKFIACNRVPNFPVEKGHLLPGCGAMVAAIEAASGRKPDYIVGKPNTFLLKLIAQKNGFKAGEILILGDVPESDIVMANRFGSPSVLVNKMDFPNLIGDKKPTLSVNSLADILRLLQVKL